MNNVIYKQAGVCVYEAALLYIEAQIQTAGVKIIREFEPETLEGENVSQSEFRPQKGLGDEPQ